MRAAEHTTLDTLRVLRMMVYRADISREDAALLDTLCEPDDPYFGEPDVEYAEEQRRDSAHEGPKVERKPREETWLDAYKPLPFKKELEAKAEPTRVEIPEGKWYHSSQQKMRSESQRMLKDEQHHHRLCKLELAADEAEVEAHQRRFQFRYQKMVDYHQRVKPSQEIVKADELTRYSPCARKGTGRENFLSRID